MLTHDELLAYRVEQLEKRLDAAETARKGRSMTTASIVMAVCAVLNTAGAILVVISGR